MHTGPDKLQMQPGIDVAVHLWQQLLQKESRNTYA